MSKMPQQQRIGYITGMIDMLSFQALEGGNEARHDCIIETYYRSGRDAAMEKMWTVFLALPDKAPESIVIVLVNQACGE